MCSRRFNEIVCAFGCSGWPSALYLASINMNNCSSLIVLLYCALVGDDFDNIVTILMFVELSVSVLGYDSHLEISKRW